MISNNIMTNTITINLETLIRNYTDSMIGLILDCEEPDDREMSAEPFRLVLKHLLSTKITNVVGTLRQSYSAGETMYFVPDHMEYLVQWNKDDQDFCIVVKDGKGDTLCILAKPEIVW
jgi:hypothetical protein